MGMILSKSQANSGGLGLWWAMLAKSSDGK
jgi:hypothetical protein